MNVKANRASLITRASGAEHPQRDGKQRRGSNPAFLPLAATLRSHPDTNRYIRPLANSASK